MTFEEWWATYQLQRLQGNMMAGFAPADAWYAAKADCMEEKASNDELTLLLERESTLNRKEIMAITDRNQFTPGEIRLMARLFEDALISELIDARTKSELRVCRVKFEKMTETQNGI